MEKRECINCGGEFEIRTNRIGCPINQQVYCSKKCQVKQYYLLNKERIIERAREWEKRNPEKAKIHHKKALAKFRKNKRERFNKLMMKGYRKNKGKWNSRNQTNTILKTKKYGGSNPILRECKRCGTSKNIELHHEIYPTKTDEIKEAISNGKIYYLCRDCHGRRNHHSK